jgi:hypothetical protein
MSIKWLLVDVQVHMSSDSLERFGVGIDCISGMGYSGKLLVWAYCNEYIDGDNVKSDLTPGSPVGSMACLSCHGDSLP